MAVIDSVDARTSASGTLSLAGEHTHPDEGQRTDARAGRTYEIDRPAAPHGFVSGFCIVDRTGREHTIDLAKQASLTRNRVVELRTFLA